MAWEPIQSSGVPFEFVPVDEFDGATMVASVVSIVDASMSNAGWSLFLEAPAVLRITAQGFANGSGQQDELTWDAGGSQMNTAPDPSVAWTPSPFETGSTAALTFTANDSDGGYTYGFLIEIQVADPPPAPGEPYIIRNTARVYRGAVNNVKAWVRTETGKLDMSAFTTLEAVIWSGSGGAFRDGYTPGAWMWPNSGQNLLFTVPVTTPELGLAVFQLPPSGNSLRWIPGSLCYTILGDGVPLATGLIEVVG